MAAHVLGGEKIENIPYETMKDTKFTLNTTAAEKFCVPTGGEIAAKADKVK